MPQQDLLEQQIEDHWQEHRPRMYRGLKKRGLLQSSVQAAAELTRRALQEAKASGLPHDQAWELVREEFAFLPTESDVPLLGFDPARLTALTMPETTASPQTTGSAKAASKPNSP